MQPVATGGGKICTSSANWSSKPDSTNKATTCFVPLLEDVGWDRNRGASVKEQNVFVQFSATSDLLFQEYGSSTELSLFGGSSDPFDAKQVPSAWLGWNKAKKRMDKAIRGKSLLLIH